ncbi:MAG: carbon-nitrogen hydrolase family protein [Polyangiaceae bacterium]|nr:carbon-nitrogen hydrolase family protein [Polyangiaceae bacterium]MCL4753518.1 carbon-nitrogen hydrolase family protein [Myxococcales bacterium]
MAETNAREPLRVAAVQLQSQEDVGENLERCRHWVRRAAERGAKLVLLPENFAFMGPEADKRSIAEKIGDPGAPIQTALAAMAKESGVVLVAGGFPEASGDERRPFNTLAVYGADGTLAGSYRKIHLFDVRLPDGSEISESAATTAGREPQVIDVLGYRLGLSICYDLRFPELYRALADRGAEVLLVPAAFTLLTGKDHWHVLLRARAIEAQCFVLAAAQWGTHPKGRTTYGHSLLADPWGTVIAEASDGPGVVVAELDPAVLARVRANLPSLTHRVLGR